MLDHVFQIVAENERLVIFRLGRLQGVRKPGEHLCKTLFEMDLKI